MLKRIKIRNFFDKMFGSFRKKYYLCIVNKKRTNNLID